MRERILPVMRYLEGGLVVAALALGKAFPRRLGFRLPLTWAPRYGSRIWSRRF
jgi:hypothetical protein